MPRFLYGNLLIQDVRKTIFHRIAFHSVMTVCQATFKCGHNSEVFRDRVTDTQFQLIKNIYTTTQLKAKPREDNFFLDSIHLFLNTHQKVVYVILLYIVVFFYPLSLCCGQNQYIRGWGVPVMTCADTFDMFDILFI